MHSFTLQIKASAGVAKPFVMQYIQYIYCTAEENNLVLKTSDFNMAKIG